MTKFTTQNYHDLATNEIYKNDKKIDNEGSNDIKYIDPKTISEKQKL